jgi:transketolase
LVSLTMLDPVPAAALADLIKPHAKIATVEEHFITGGLGSIVAEVIADAGLGSKLLRIGVNDVFTDRYTEHEPNLRYLGLDSAGIAAKLKGFFR